MWRGGWWNLGIPSYYSPISKGWYHIWCISNNDMVKKWWFHCISFVITVTLGGDVVLWPNTPFRTYYFHTFLFSIWCKPNDRQYLMYAIFLFVGRLKWYLLLMHYWWISHFQHSDKCHWWMILFISYHSWLSPFLSFLWGGAVVYVSSGWGLIIIIQEISFMNLYHFWGGVW